MERIEADRLYDERGSVSWCRPLLQGDVYNDVVLPGFGDEPRLVQVVTHPCAMRRGPDMNDRITVAPVEPYQLIEGDDWDGHLRVMPLADLHGNGTSFATKFVDVTAAPSELLTLGRRIASLSNRGIYVLQQRLVKHYTRFDVPIDVLRKQAAPVLQEAEMQYDWVETVLGDNDPTIEAVAAAERTFQTWLSDGDPPRRTLLDDDTYHADLRREAHRAAEAGAAG